LSWITSDIDRSRHPSIVRQASAPPVRPYADQVFPSKIELLHPPPIGAQPVRKFIAIMTLAIGLAACGVVSTLVDGFKFAKAVEADLQEVTGIKPAVGFNWNNGRLVSVTVTFPRLYEAKPLGELAESARVAVTKEFKQAPENIVLAFTLGAAPGRSAQAGQAPVRMTE
jgi:hypothetical protein